MASDIVETSPAPYEGRFGRFARLLGEGAVKSVYEAVDKDHGKLVAWNEVRSQHLSEEQRSRLEREVEILGGVRNANIIDFYGAWSTADRFVFITEIVESGDLQRFVSTHPVKLKIIKRWCRQILSALAYLHAQSPPIIHCDVKCENMLYNAAEGTIKIGDLGLSTTNDSVGAVAGDGDCANVCGTPAYMAPEMYEGVVNEGVDIYAYGLAVLEMISHAPPYSECTNPAQIFKRVVEGVEPAALGRIRVPAVAEFIRFCINPRVHVAREASSSIRPSASEVLAHPFLDESAPLSPEDDESYLIAPDDAEPIDGISPLVAGGVNNSITVNASSVSSNCGASEVAGGDFEFGAVADNQHRSGSIDCGWEAPSSTPAPTAADGLEREPERRSGDSSFSGNASFLEDAGVGIPNASAGAIGGTFAEPASSPYDGGRSFPLENLIYDRGSSGIGSFPDDFLAVGGSFTESGGIGNGFVTNSFGDAAAREFLLGRTESYSELHSLQTLQHTGIASPSETGEDAMTVHSSGRRSSVDVGGGRTVQNSDDDDRRLSLDMTGRVGNDFNDSDDDEGGSFGAAAGASIPDSMTGSQGVNRGSAVSESVLADSDAAPLRSRESPLDFLFNSKTDDATIGGSSLSSFNMLTSASSSGVVDIAQLRTIEATTDPAAGETTEDTFAASSSSAPPTSSPSAPVAAASRILFAGRTPMGPSTFSRTTDANVSDVSGALESPISDTDGRSTSAALNENNAALGGADGVDAGTGSPNQLSNAFSDDVQHLFSPQPTDLASSADGFSAINSLLSPIGSVLLGSLAPFTPQQPLVSPRASEAGSAIKSGDAGDECDTATTVNGASQPAAVDASASTTFPLELTASCSGIDVKIKFIFNAAAPVAEAELIPRELMQTLVISIAAHPSGSAFSAVGGTIESIEFVRFLAVLLEAQRHGWTAWIHASCGGLSVGIGPPA